MASTVSRLTLSRLVSGDFARGARRRPTRRSASKCCPALRSELLHRPDLDDRMGSNEDLRGLCEGVVVLAGDDVEAGQLLDGFGEGALSNERTRSRSAPDGPGPVAVAERGTPLPASPAGCEPPNELLVRVEGGLVAGRRAGQPFRLTVGGEHDDVLGHGASPLSDGLTTI